MRIFLRTAALFWKNWPRALVAYFCLFAGAGLALYIPRLTGQAVDQALAGQTQALMMTAIIIGGAGLVRSVFSYFQTYLAEFLSQKVAYDLRNQLYNRIQKLSYAFHDRSQTGQLMSRATSDVEGVHMFVSFALLRGVYLIILMVVITVLLILLDWKLAIVSLSVLPLISYRTIVINQQLRQLWKKIQQTIGVMGTVLQENLTGARVVRAFAREDYESEKFRKQAESVYNMEIEANNRLAANSPLMTFLLALAMAAVLLYGGYLVINGTLTQGEFVQFLFYLVMLGMPVRTLGWLTILFSRATASGRRIFEIIDQVSPVVERPDATDVAAVKGQVIFEHVSFNYDSHSAVLTDIDFKAEPGQIIALVGASGSGKSTLANLIPRFYDITSGRITIDDIDIRNMTLASLRRHVGIVHQDTFLFSATIRENISYGKPDATLDEIIAAAKVARLHDFVAGLPDGYETWVGERGITLSGGQKQRLAIARTILLNPRILIMDDSTSSVDTQTEYLIQQAMAELPVGRTTFIIAHRLRSVQIAHLILVLQDGKIIERGKHQELLEKGGLYRRLYDLQFRDEETPEETPVLVTETETAPLMPEEGTRLGHEQHRRASLSTSDDIVYGKPYDSRVVTRLIPYFALSKIALPLTIVATLLYTFSNVASPYLVSIAENKYILTGNLSGLLMITIFFVANALLNWGSYYLQIRAEAKLGQGVLYTLRRQLFDHLQRLSVRFFDDNEVGRLMSRVQSDVGELGDFLDSGAFWVIGEVVTLIAIIVVLFTMDVKLALLSLSVIPILFVFIFIWQRLARQSFIKVRQAISAVNAALEENISGIRVIQSLSREDLNFQHFEEVNRKHFAANLRAAVLSAGLMPVVEFLIAVAISLIMLFGGGQVSNGTLLVGTLIAFILYIQNFFDPIRMMTMEYSQLQRAMASGSRIFELTDVKPEMAESSSSIKDIRLRGDIKFENVSFSYDPEIEVLRNINLHIPAGQTVALVGPTGAGKSTMFSLITRFYDITTGRITVDGTDIRDIDKTTYRRQLGLVLQDPFLFSGTIRENICYGKPEATDEEMVSAAKTVGVHDFIKRMENSYNTELQERGQNLSMGQRQLISFARALLVNPAILLLDEATANVDSYSELLIQEGLQRLRQGRTTVIIAHRLSTIRDAGIIVVIDKGQIIEQGRHEELLLRNGLYTRLYEMTYASLATGK
jgi:ATP-binding cassette subfamily B protein